jgi:hypothetical protein
MEKLQKKAIRTVNKAKYNSHTEPLFKKSEILPLRYLIKYFKLLFMYDYRNDLVPISFKNVWLTNAQKRIHDNPLNVRTLRDDHLYAIPYIRLDHFFKFPLADLPRMWNEFNFEIAAQSRNIFKTMLKEHFLSCLTENVVCQRLLCPVCHLRAADQDVM